MIYLQKNKHIKIIVRINIHLKISLHSNELRQKISQKLFQLNTVRISNIYSLTPGKSKHVSSFAKPTDIEEDFQTLFCSHKHFPVHCISLKSLLRHSLHTQLMKNVHCVIPRTSHLNPKQRTKIHKESRSSEDLFFKLVDERLISTL